MYGRVLAKNWRVILPVFLLTLGVTAFLTARQQPVYEASATYVVKLNTILIDDRNFVSALDILSRRTEISTTYAEIAKSRSIKTQAADNLNLPEQSRRNLSVDARLIPGTNLLELTVQASDLALAVDFINAIGEATQAYVDNLYEVYALEELDAPVARSSPVSPRTALNLAVGAMAGLLLGVSMAFLAAYLQGPQKVANESLPSNLPQTAARATVGEDVRQELFSLQRQLSISREQLHHVEVMLYGIHAVSVETHEAIGRMLDHPAENGDGAKRGVETAPVEQPVRAYDGPLSRNVDHA
jgi:capsular polysaccharide biosynthesis protein